MIKLKSLYKENFNNDIRKNFLEIISTFNKFGKQLKREQDISDIAENLSGIANAARMFSVNEAEDWFDGMTVKKNMEALGKIAEEFKKVANESKVHEDRMNALYDDMGHILGRYFEIADLPDEAKLKQEEADAEMAQKQDTYDRIMGAYEKVKAYKNRLKEVAAKLKEEKGRIQNATTHVQMHKERLKAANEDLRLKKERIREANKKIKESKLRLKGLYEKYKTPTESVNEMENPCWKGYEMVGTKMKNGREVPNCVPKNEIKENNCGCNSNHDCGCGGVHKH